MENVLSREAFSGAQLRVDFCAREPREDHFQLGRSWWDQRETKGLNAICGEGNADYRGRGNQK
jgi:hypothetical protein